MSGRRVKAVRAGGRVVRAVVTPLAMVAGMFAALWSVVLAVVAAVAAYGIAGWDGVLTFAYGFGIRDVLAQRSRSDDR